MHNDLKLENMLVAGDQIKLCDFGLAGRIGQRRRGVPHGTTPYMAPELIAAKEDDLTVLSPALDVWSFAIALYIITFLDTPWKSASMDDPKYHEFVSNPSVRLMGEWGLLTLEFQACMMAMLDPLPERRPTIREVAASLLGKWTCDPTLPVLSAMSPTPSPIASTSGHSEWLDSLRVQTT